MARACTHDFLNQRQVSPFADACPRDATSRVRVMSNATHPRDPSLQANVNQTVLAHHPGQPYLSFGLIACIVFVTLFFVIWSQILDWKRHSQPLQMMGKKSPSRDSLNLHRTRHGIVTDSVMTEPQGNSIKTIRSSLVESLRNSEKILLPDPHVRHASPHLEQQEARQQP